MDKCDICNKKTVQEYNVEIRDGFLCYNCKKSMLIMLLFEPYKTTDVIDPLTGDIVDCICSEFAYKKPKSLIFLANNHNILLQERFSRHEGYPYIMHICPHCNSHQGDYYVVKRNKQKNKYYKNLQNNTMFIMRLN